MRRRRVRRDPRRGRRIAFVALGLGANQDHRREVLGRAVRRLAVFLEQPRVAPLYETEPVSDVPQGLFLNTALTGETALGPADLLAVAKAIEMAAGRRRGERWGPRPLDVDLLLYDDLVRDDPELTLPHPRLRQRLFQLEPLAQIVPEQPVPPDGTTVRDLRDRLGGEVGHAINWSPLG